MINWIKDLLVGFFIGLANIIPGVSGGTFLLIFGIYERVISIINNLGIESVKKIIDAKVNILNSENKKGAISDFFKLLNDMDLFFFIRVIVGALFAIVSLSALMKYLLKNQFTPTYALFFGLILISMIIPFKLLKKRSIVLFIPFIIGTILTVFVAISVNPADKALKKSNIYKAKFEIPLGKDLLTEPVSQDNNQNSTAFTYTGKYSTGEYLYAALTGATAISAMVLPGISGSLVMILMGEYFEIINAISGLKTMELDYIFFLSVFAIGMLGGLLLFARLIKFVFDRFYDMTMALLLGLMVGSLYTLWPFKSFIVTDLFVKNHGVIRVIEKELIYTNKNILWSDSNQLIIALVAFFIGGVIMYLFTKKEISGSK